MKLLLLIAAAAATFWMFGPSASGTAETPLESEGILSSVWRAAEPAAAVASSAVGLFTAGGAREEAAPLATKPAAPAVPPVRHPKAPASRSSALDVLPLDGPSGCPPPRPAGGASDGVAVDHPAGLCR